MEGVIIAPIQAHDRVLIPMGAKVAGVVRDARVGLDLVHEAGRLGIDFNELTLRTALRSLWIRV